MRLRSDDEPGGDRHQDQQAQHALDDRRGVQDQRDDVEACFSGAGLQMREIRGSIGSPSARGSLTRLVPIRSFPYPMSTRIRLAALCVAAGGRAAYGSTVAPSRSAGSCGPTTGAPSPIAVAPTPRSQKCSSTLSGSGATSTAPRRVRGVPSASSLVNGRPGPHLSKYRRVELEPMASHLNTRSHSRRWGGRRTLWRASRLRHRSCGVWSGGSPPRSKRFCWWLNARSLAQG